MRDCQALILGKIWIRANMLDMQHHIYHLDPHHDPLHYHHHDHPHSNIIIIAIIISIIISIIHPHHHTHHLYHHLYHSSLSFITITILMIDCSTNEGAGSADQDSDHCSWWLPQRPHPCLRGRNTRKVLTVAAEGREEGRGDSNYDDDDYLWWL